MVIFNKNFKAVIPIALLFSILFTRSIHADNGMPNHAPRPKSQNRTINIFADFLYWHTSETVDWAFKLQNSQNSIKSSYQTLTFDWAPGFRVGLGYDMKHDHWDTQASYTWFQSRATGRVSGAVTPAFLASRLSLLEPFSTGRASLNLHYSMFDWDLGRSFLASKYLIMRPFIGLKAGWINQSIHSNWTKPLILGFFLSASENLKQNFQGGGPKGGFTGKWCLQKNQQHSLNIIGQFEAAFLWGQWSIHDKYIDNLATIIHVHTSKRNFGAFMLHAFLGFGYDCYFDHKRSHFSIKLGYEIEDWLNQFQIFTDASGSQNNNLILQGLNLGLRLDF